MKNLNSRRPGLLVLGLGLGLGLMGCQKTTETRWQGYLEGEYVYVAAPLAGRLEHLAVSRGQTVRAGESLFNLEQEAEAATEREAAERWHQAEAQLQDLRKGQRPSELATLDAQWAQARATQELAAIEEKRIGQLLRSQVVPVDDYDRVRIKLEQATAAVTEIDARRETARVGARVDQIEAAEAALAGARANWDRAQWAVSQKTVTAPVDALVFDTLYRPGELVAAAQPVVVLLPPANLKVRFFVPEAVRATLAVSDVVQVALSGRDRPLPARVVYLAPQAEFTPPVLYNRENRAKLVFMIEAVFEAGAGVELQPGQPVDVAR